MEAMGLHVVAVRHDGENGRLSDFKLSDGREVNYSECYQMIERGEIPSLMTGVTRNGDTAIRSKRGYDNYSLDSLPTF